MKWVLLLLTLLLTVPSVADAATINAVSCSNTHVGDAITAAANGDTVQIPGGTCTWSADVTFSGKYFTLKGVGKGTPAQCAVGGQTTYTCIQRAGKMIDWTLSVSGNTVIRDFTILGPTGASGCSLASNHLLNFRGVSDLFRMTNMVVQTPSDNSCPGVLWRGSITGVVDHSTFEQDGTVAAMLVITHESWKNVGLYGDNSWAQADSMGAAGAGDA